MSAQQKITDCMARRLLWLLLAALAGMGIGFVVCGLWARTLDNGIRLPAETDTTRTHYVDTATYRVPVPVDSVVVRYRTVLLPVAVPPDSTCDESVPPDSVPVIVPIGQQHFRGKEYEAWVSGYDVRMDSLRVFQPRDVVTVRIRDKPKRWHIGVSAGYGLTPHGMEPFVGLTATYSFVSF